MAVQPLQGCCQLPLSGMPSRLCPAELGCQLGCLHLEGKSPSREELTSPERSKWSAAHSNAVSVSLYWLGVLRSEYVVATSLLGTARKILTSASESLSSTFRRSSCCARTEEAAALINASVSVQVAVLSSAVTARSAKDRIELLRFSQAAFALCCRFLALTKHLETVISFLLSWAATTRKKGM